VPFFTPSEWKPPVLLLLIFLGTKYRFLPILKVQRIDFVLSIDYELWDPQSLKVLSCHRAGNDLAVTSDLKFGIFHDEKMCMVP